MKKIKIILLIVFSLLILSCDCENKLTGGGGSDSMKSVIIDNRCVKIQSDEFVKIKEQKARDCAPKPGVYPVSLGGSSVDLTRRPYVSDYYEYYQTPEKCKLLSESFRKRVNELCKALPPPGPGDVDVLSGNAFLKDGKLVAVDGEPVCN